MLLLDRSEVRAIICQIPNGDLAAKLLKQIDALPIVDSAEWQPIETAPKDGEPLLLSFDGFYVGPGNWREPSLAKGGAGCWCRLHTYDPFVGKATHWQRFPKPAGLEAVNQSSS